MRQACRKAAEWGQSLFPDAVFEVLTEPGRTPALFFDIPATRDDEAPAVFFYGHFDKQPEGEGWSNGRKPFEPTLESERLYGRGAADDGYNFYAAMVALHALEKRASRTAASSDCTRRTKSAARATLSIGCRRVERGSGTLDS